LVRLIHKLLISRMVTATVGTSTQTRLVNRGTPQGGVLSPLLWNIAVNKLLRILEGGGGKVVAYADDVAIIFNGKYPQTLCDLMTAKLKILSKWTIANGLGVNPSKTELVLFTNRYKIPQLNPPILNTCNLSFSDHARYLGFVLDKRLKWGLNNQERTKKATIALYSCKKAIGLRWGMSPRIVNWIYTAVIKPILLYGVALWKANPVSGQQFHHEQRRSIQPNYANTSSQLVVRIKSYSTWNIFPIGGAYTEPSQTCLYISSDFTLNAKGLICRQQ